MKSLDKMIEKLPEDLRLPMYEVITFAIEESRNILIRDEITKVWEGIGKLTEAQNRSEERLSRLEKVVEELAEAQNRAEERLSRLEKVVEELAEAQNRAEARLSRLEKVVEELTEAQKRAEERLSRLEKVVEELAEAQNRAEERLSRLEKVVEELAEAQKRTEKNLNKLVLEFSEMKKEFREMKKQFGGLSDSVGYTLENEAFKHLPILLLNDFGIKIQERMKRTYLKNAEGKEKEVNIYGIGKRDGEEVTIVGEAKSQLSKNEIDKFLKKLEKFKGLYKNIIPIFVTHMISEPDAEIYAKEKGIKVYYSYEFQ
jgi:chromosome segregation ATPase